MRHELEVSHVGHDGVGNLGGLAYRFEVQTEIALRGSVHGARLRQPTAEEIERGNVLSHCTCHYHVQVFGVGPDSWDYAFPVLSRTLLHDEVGEFRVGFENFGHAFSDADVCDFRAQCSS